jgi:hypothetical protein
MGLENLSHRCVGKTPDRGNPSTAHAHIGFADPVGAGHRSAANEKIEHLSSRLS